MREIDDTDREILRLLLEDGRRPYRDIADHVDLSPPAVSDRVERLRELGVIRRFTVDVDRSTLREGTDVLVEVRVPPGSVGELHADLREVDGVEHVFQTADARLLFTVTLRDGALVDHLDRAIDLDRVIDLDVSPLTVTEWHPGVGEATLGLTCAECGNTVTSEGVAATIGGDPYEFCCPSCRARFEDRYEELSEGA